MFKFTKAEIKEAVIKSDGTFTSVAKNLKGVKSSQTAKKFVEKYPDLLEEFNNIADQICDKATHTLIELMDSADNQVRARVSEFFLKNSPRSPFVIQKGEDIQTQLIGLLNKMIDSAES